MQSLLVTTAALVTIGAAVRSTWSPCGWSMLSTITPLGEAGRGRRFWPTATWFLVGATAGGALLGAVMALPAWAVGNMSASASQRLLVAGCLAVVCAASDARLGGWALPFHRRQVNEDWLDLYRPWVYGAGFGLQIGCGLATFITTASIYLTIALGALTGNPRIAAVLGLSFGIVRGLAVFAGRKLNSPAALRAFHARFEIAGMTSFRVVIAVQLMAAVAIFSEVWLPGGVLVGIGVLLVLAIRRLRASVARGGVDQADQLVTAGEALHVGPDPLGQ